MNNLEFKRVGMVILENSAGDVLLNDPSTNLEAVLVAELIHQEKEDERLCMILARQFIGFIKNHRQLRMKKIRAEIEEIRKTDPKKAGYIERKLEAGNLFQAQRDAHFFHMGVPKH